MRKYWENRLANGLDELLIANSELTNKKLRKEYQRSFKAIEGKIERLYNKIMVDGKPSITELYRFNRYYELMANIQSDLEKLGKREQVIISQDLTKLYLTTANSVEEKIGISFSKIDSKAAKMVVNQVWCADGKNWSDRIWEHKGKLREELSSCLLDMITQGLSVDKVSKTIAERFGVSYSNATRLVRTEMNNIQTQAAKDRYIAAGWREYEILATHDSRTSKICREMDGKKFLFEQYLPGETAPPFHPNCRTTIIPV